MIRYWTLVISALILACYQLPKGTNSDDEPSSVESRSSRPRVPVNAYVYKETGLASFSADDQHGRPTASGVIYDMRDLVAAHPELPFGTVVRVTNQVNNHSVRVKIIDRGPFVNHRVIDLSFEAAKALGFVEQGVTPVEITIVELPY